jgi:hypothetical protein
VSRKNKSIELERIAMCAARSGNGDCVEIGMKDLLKEMELF